MQQNPQTISQEKEDSYQEEDKKYPRQHAADLDQFIKFMEGGYRSVYFIGQNFKSGQLNKFMKSIMHAKGTEDLYIWENGLNTEGAKQLKQALYYNSNISKLYISKNDFKAAAAEHIGEMIANSQSLTELSLKKNDLQDKGIAFVARALKQNNTLRKLDLTDTKLGDAGMKDLALALRENHALKKLEIYKNNVTDKGAEFIKDILKSNGSMTSLDLKDNKLTDQGFKLIADGLRENTGMSDMAFDKNDFTASGMKEILDALSQNETVTRMQFGQGNNVDAGVKEQIEKRLAENEKKQQELYLSRLQGTHKAPWRRSKLMVVGEGGAGKTATVRSLLNKVFDENWDSTVGVAITETNAQDVWTPDGKNGFAQTIAQRLAVLAQEDERQQAEKEKKKRKNQPKRAMPKELEGSSDAKDEEEEEKQEEKQEETKKAPASNESEKKKEQQPAQSKVEDSINLDEIENEPLEKLFPFDATMVAKGRDEGEGVRMSIWDYGGQDVFYTLHHLFLTKYGVYLVVFDMTKMLKNDKGSMDFLKFWLNSIRFHASEAPLLMVGTFGDKLGDPKDVEKVEKVVGEMVKGNRMIIKNDKDESSLSFFPINNKEKEGIVELRKMIENVTVDQDFVNTEVSIQWMRALDIVLEAKEEYVTLSKMKAIGNKVGIKSATEVEEMLKLFHELGVILHFTATVNLAEIVTTKPQWLIDAVSLVIRDPELHPFDKKQFKDNGLLGDLESLFSKAIASRDLLDFMWKKERSEFLIDLMRKLLLMSTWHFEEEKDKFLVPSMIRNVQKVKTKGVAAKFEFDFLPIGVFERLVCLAVDYSSTKPDAPKPVLGKETSQVFFGKDSAISLVRDGDVVQVFVEASDEAHKILDIILAMLRKLNDDVMDGAIKSTVTLEGSDGKFVGLDEARKAKLQPWFEAEKKAVTATNFDSFLEKF